MPVDGYCKGCRYLGTVYDGKCCNYLTATGHARGCSAGKGCDKKASGRTRNFGVPLGAKPREVKNPLPKRTNNREQNRERSRIFKESSRGLQKAALNKFKEENGFTSRNIADKIGVSLSTVRGWCQECGPANWALLATIGLEKPEEL